MYTYKIEEDDGHWRASLVHEDGSETSCFGTHPVDALENLLAQIVDFYCIDVGIRAQKRKEEQRAKKRGKIDVKGSNKAS